MNQMTQNLQTAGLGQAPFKFKGFTIEKYQACQGAPIQCGGTCDYCPAAIMNTYWFESADGNRFKLGSVCAEKVFGKGSALASKVAEIERKRKAARRTEMAAEKIAAMVGSLELDSVRSSLSGLQHPNSYRASQGDTMLSWVEFMIKNAGQAGKLKAAKVVASMVS